MSGETAKDESGWTIDSLRYHFQQQIDDMRRLLDERYATQTKALDAALVAADKRFDSVNEFRKTLSDQTAGFIPRTEYDAAHDALVDRVNDLNDRINRAEGSTAGVRMSTGVLVSVVTVAVLVIGLIVTVANYAASH